MIEITVDTAGADRLFRKLGQGTGGEIKRAVSRAGLLLETRVKAKASGRPGPNAPTGDYRRSINTKLSSSGANAEATVGTNKPQANRLEYGFSGTDRLGRHYNQPPYPHWKPAVMETRDQIVRDIANAALGKGS